MRRRDGNPSRRRGRPSGQELGPRPPCSYYLVIAWWPRAAPKSDNSVSPASGKSDISALDRVGEPLRKLPIAKNGVRGAAVDHFRRCPSGKDSDKALRNDSHKRGLDAPRGLAVRSPGSPTLTARTRGGA